MSMPKHEKGSVNLSDVLERAAIEHPDTPLLADTPWRFSAAEVRTRKQFLEFAEDVADRLWAAGVRARDRVVICKTNHVDILGIAVAVMRIGAVPVLLSDRMLPDELSASLQRLPKPHLIVDHATAARFEHARRTLAQCCAAVLSLGDEHVDWVVPAVARTPHVRTRRPPNELAIVNHTSGANGNPKLTGHSDETLYAHAAAAIERGRVSEYDGGTSLCCLSFVHACACATFLIALALDRALLAVSDERPAHVKRLLLTHRPTMVAAHPNIHQRWTKLAAEPERPFACVRRYVSMLDATHPRTVRALLAGSDQPDAAYLQVYGQTECGPVTTAIVTRKDLERFDSRSVGKAVPNYARIRIIDDGGRTLAPGEVGHVHVQTKGLLLGYLGRGRVPRGSWWPMRDYGRLQPDGTLELLDRLVDRAQGHDSLLALEDAMLEALPELTEIVFVQSKGRLIGVVCVEDDRPLDIAGWRLQASKLGIADVPVQQRRWEDIPFAAGWKVRRNVLARAVEERAGSYR